VRQDDGYAQTRAVIVLDASKSMNEGRG